MIIDIGDALSGTVIIAGLKFNVQTIEVALRNPPADRLLNIRREGDNLLIHVIYNADEAKKFFDEISK